MSVNVTPQPTPNPTAYKFSLDRPVIESGSQTYASAAAAAAHPLAAAIFAVSGVASVFLLKNFVTVTRAPDARWQDLVPAVEEAIRGHYR